MHSNGHGTARACEDLRTLQSGALLVTGATGLVGQGLIPLLQAAHPERQIVVLARKPDAVKLTGVFRLQGDVCSPGLGLSPEMRKLLCERVTELIHSAADIRFRIPIEESRRTNVEGTREMLRFAEDCANLERFLHVSTIYAAGKTTGIIREDLVDPEAGFVNAYQQSKNEAEHLVHEAMSRLPVSIARLSSLIGSSCGKVRQFNYFHQVIKAIPWNPLPAIPADPSAMIDMAASDWTNKALHFLYDCRFEAKRIYHVCAGPKRSWNVSKLLNSTYEVFEKHHPQMRLRRRPKLVPFEEFEQILGKIRYRIPSALDEWLEALFSFLPHLSMQQQFDNSRTEALLGENVPFPSLDSYFHDVVDYCVASNWGRSA